MKQIGTALVVVVVVLAAGWLTFSYYEAEKELKVLCSHFHPGQSRSKVERVLGTGEYLRYRAQTGPDGERIVADSPFNLQRTRCVVTFDGAVVTGARYE